MANMDTPATTTRIMAIVDERSQYERLVNEWRIRKARRSRLPPATKYNLQPG